jgi:hypothetical protein
MNEEIENVKTDEWKLYEKGKNYNIMMGLYQDTEDNYDFYHGNQWKGAKLGSIQPITLNIIRPTVKYKVGVLNSNSYEIVFNPNIYETLEEAQRMEETCKVLNRYSNRIWEIEQVNKKVREVLKDACINSEGIVHAYEENEKIKVEIIDKTNIYYGNENDSDIQEQPYILITYRRTVDSVKEEARKYGTSEEEILKITADSDIEEQAGRDKRVEEISPMCLVVLKYYKKDGTIWMKKSTKNAVVRKESDTKLKLYPVAHMVWEEVKGYSRGEGEVKYLRPNQIELNKTATRRSIAIQIGAYPKLVANMQYVTNPSALDKVGARIELQGIQADDVNKVVSYLRPSTMSSDAVNFQQELIKNTQELAGAGDTVNGNVDPTQASGKAILAVQHAGQQPLNDQLEKFKSFIEDLARIWFEMLQTYSLHGVTTTREIKDEITGTVTEEPYQISYEELQNMKPNIKIDITPKSPYDIYAQEQSLENLLNAGYITYEEYVDIIPDGSAMPKYNLQKKLREREEKQKRIDQMQMQAQEMQSQLGQAMRNQENTMNDIDRIQNEANGMQQGLNEALEVG